MYNSMCTGIDANFSTWGACIMGGVGLGSEIILIIVSFAILVFLMYKFNIPTQASIVIGLGMVFAMITTFGDVNNEIMQAILALTMLGLAVLIVLSALKFAKK